MIDQFAARVNFLDADYSDLLIPKDEISILRDLAKRVAEIAERPDMAEKKELWIAHNNLKQKRPMVMCDPENGWNEIILEDELKCKNSVAKYWEYALRKLIFWGEEMNDDFVITKIFKIPYNYSATPWINKNDPTKFNIIKTDPTGGSFHIDTVLENMEDMDQLAPSELTIDFALSDQVLTLAHETFDGLLDVQRYTYWWWGDDITNQYALIRGLENMMLDFYDYPDEMNTLLDWITNSVLSRMDYLQENGLLNLNNYDDYVGSGGLGFTDQLPTKAFNGQVTTQNMWGFIEAQMTSTVSGEFYREFILPYHKKIAERFALVCVGCCEPLENRIEYILKEVPNTRRVSVSHWANKERMSEILQRNYIYSSKPTPVDLASPVIDEKHARGRLRDLLKITRNNNAEFIMKDNHTIGKNIDNVKNWVKIFREESGTG